MAINYSVASGQTLVFISGTAPVKPKVGDLWFDDSTTLEMYIYDGTQFVSTTGTGKKTVVVGSAPTHPADGDLWFDDSTTLELFIYSDSDNAWISTTGTGQEQLDSEQIISMVQEVGLLGDSDLKVVADLRNDVDSDAEAFAAFTNRTGALKIEVKNESGADMPAGSAVFINGVSGEKPTVGLARANSPSTMPAFGVLQDAVNNNASGAVIFSGYATGVNTSSFSEGDTVFVSADSDGKFTNVKPTGETHLIQNVGKVIRSHQESGVVVVVGAGRSNDIDNHTRAMLDSDSTKIQSMQEEIDKLRADADSDSLTIQFLQYQIDSLKVFEFTASTTSATFSGNDDNAQTLAYTAGRIKVFLNGIRMKSSDFTATNGTSLTLDTAPDVGDVLQIDTY